jgi:hypothetical protein
METGGEVHFWGQKLGRAATIVGTIKFVILSSPWRRSRRWGMNMTGVRSEMVPRGIGIPLVLFVAVPVVCSRHGWRMGQGVRRKTDKLRTPFRDENWSDYKTEQSIQDLYVWSQLQRRRRRAG